MYECAICHHVGQPKHTRPSNGCIRWLVGLLLFPLGIFIWIRLATRKGKTICGRCGSENVRKVEQESGQEKVTGLLSDGQKGSSTTSLQDLMK